MDAGEELTMPAPVPYDALVGAVNDPAESEALNLRGQYAWLYRLAKAMTDDPELDLKRAAQLALHTRKFRLWFDKLVERISRETVSADPDYPGILAQRKISLCKPSRFHNHRHRPEDCARKNS